jgi:dTDP-4-dehydrorhamnose reductase
MRVLVTGGAGFVGSNVVAVAAERGDDVAAVVRKPPPRPERRCRYLALDLLDAEAVRAALADVRPDVVVHTAIWNDFAGIYADRRRAGASYVGVTETLADSTRETDAVLVTVSHRLGLRRHAVAADGGGSRPLPTSPTGPPFCARCK